MNGKPVSYSGQEGTLVGEHLNPFIHRLELTSTYAKLKTAFFTVAVLPVRVAAICGLLVIAWCIACIGLYGVSDEELRTKPMTGWRKKLRDVISLVGQLTYRVGGMSVTVKGRQASRQEAPIMVIAPHSTFLDAVVVYVTGFPSIIARWESGLNPWLGKLINYTQPVYVWREDADSRQKTIREISYRANSDLDWPQVLIFPEGTCTNRSCLITFKCGAFYPGVPVQPVCIRYPNKLDTVTWTWEGPGALKLLWLTLTQMHSNCEIEFLPVYRPNAEEKSNPKLFANNVRKVMAKALGVPVTNFTYDHCRLIITARRLHLPLGGSLVEMQRLRECLGVDKTKADEEFLHRPVEEVSVNRQQFADKLKVSSRDAVLKQLFELCDVKCEGKVNWLEYLLAILVISSDGHWLTIVQTMFLLLNKENDGRICREVFEEVTGRAFSWSSEKSNIVFKKISSSKSSYISFSDFIKYAEKSADLRFLFKDSHRSRLKSD